MSFPTKAIIQIYLEDPSIPGSTATGYTLTDHNRQPLQINYERIEKSDRMADGTMRRFITANKKKLSTSWSDLPSNSGIEFIADGNLGGAFLKSFFEENVYQPVWVKLTYSEEAWRQVSSLNSINNYTANTTFKPSVTNTSTPSAYSIVSASISAISTGVGTASVTTNVRATGYTAGNLVYVSGLDPIFNGTASINSVTHTASNSILTYNISNPTVVANAFLQSGTTASFNLDATYWAKSGTVFTTKNMLMTSGSTINNVDWTYASNPQTNLITATSTSSQTAGGRNGMITLKTTTSIISKPISTFYASTIAPAVSSDIVKCFITNFDYKINKRLTYTDRVDISLELTEI
jgi:hypothetical protein